jgi:hypothetical protein
LDIGCAPKSNFFYAEGNVLILNGQIAKNESAKIMIKFKYDISPYDPKFIINDDFINVYFKSSTQSKLEFEEFNEIPLFKKEMSEIPSDINNTNNHNMNNNLNISLNFLSNNEDQNNHMDDLSKEYYNTDNASTNEIIGIAIDSHRPEPLWVFIF